MSSIRGFALRIHTGAVLLSVRAPCSGGVDRPRWVERSISCALMTSDPSPADTLRAHVALCSELHALFLEENRVLRTTGAPPSEELLARKREFLPQLDASLERLRRINETQPRFTPEEQVLVQDGRKKLMQLLMLDRENERLLLRTTLPPQIKSAYAPVIPGRIAKAYGKYAPGSGGLKTEG